MANFGEGDSQERVSTQEESALLPNQSVDSVDSVQQSAPVEDVVKCHAAELVGNILREELRRSASNTVRRDLSRNRKDIIFPFNRHTVTVGLGEEYVDFVQSVRDLPKVQKTQVWVAKEIEKVKRGQVTKYTQSEQAWKKDFKNSRYIYDLNNAEILTKGFGDAVSNPFSCMFESPVSTENSEDTICYNCYNMDDTNIITSPYVFNSTITPYPLMYSCPMPDVEI